MATINIGFNPQTDGGTLSGGSWETSLPLSNLQTRRPEKLARTTDTLLSSTKFYVDAGNVIPLGVVALAHTNLTTEAKYRITVHEDGDFDNAITQTDWLSCVVGELIKYGSLPYGAPYWYEMRRAWEDPDRKPMVTHVFTEKLGGRYLEFEVDDQNNPDGYVEAGRFFVPETLAPTRSFSFDNALTIKNNVISATTLSGGVQRWRRPNPRTFRFGIQYLPEDEVYRDFWRFIRLTGFDREVIVVPDPDDSDFMMHRSFIGTLSEIDAIVGGQAKLNNVGFQVEEIIA